MEAATDTTPADRHRPGKATIDPNGGFSDLRQKPDEFNCALFAAFQHSDFLGGSQPLVSSDAVQSIAKRASKQRRNSNWTVVLRPLFRAQPEADRLITTDLGHSVVQGAHLFRRKPDTCLLEQLGWQCRQPQHGIA